MKTNTYSNGVTRFTKGLLDVMFYFGIAATAALPWFLRWLGRMHPALQHGFWIFTALFMLSGVGAVLIVYELRRMFSTVLKNDCFVTQNVVSLRRMGVYGLAIAVFTLCRLVLVFTPAEVVIFVVFVLAALFSFVLSHVFAEAVRYKEENDLTI